MKKIESTQQGLRGQFEAIVPCTAHGQVSSLIHRINSPSIIALKLIPVRRSYSTILHFDIPRFPCTVIVCGPAVCSLADNDLSVNHPGGARNSPDIHD
jgi:hypothetical protein